MTLGQLKEAIRGRRTQLLGAFLWAFFVAVIGNYIWEFLGPTLKLQLVVLSIVALCCFYLRPRASLSEGAKDCLAVLFVAIAVLLSARGVLSAAQFLKSEYRFAQRVDTFVQRSHKLYRNPYESFIPTGVYAWMKTRVGRQFEPELFDCAHQYDRIEIRCFDLLDRAIVEYQCWGRSYGRTPLPICFVFQGEADLERVNRAVSVVDGSTGKDLEPDLRALKCGAGTFAIFGKFYVPEGDFYFVRSLCVEGALSEDIEGFVVDLRNLAHPPETITLTFATDKDIHSPDVWAVCHAGSPRRWLLGLPSSDCQPLSGRQELDICDQERQELLQVLQEGEYKYLGNAQLRRWMLPCSGTGDCFLLKYRVLGRVGCTPGP